MRVAITGHTRGIGQALMRHLQRQGHEVRGYSKSNGYSLPESIDKLVKEIAGYDLFINNAYWGFSQALIMDRLLKQWRDVPDKRIICLGSVSADLTVTDNPLYSAAKVALEKTCHLSQSARVWPQVVNLKLGMVDTPRSEKYQSAKLTPEEVCLAIDWILDLPPHISIPEIIVKHRDQLTPIG